MLSAWSVLPLPSRVGPVLRAAPLIGLFFARTAAATEPIRPVPVVGSLPDMLTRDDVRAGRWIGIGTSMGYSGVSAVYVGARVWGVLNPTFTFSPLGTVDGTLHLDVLPTRWTPVVGIGYTYGYPYLLGNLGSRPVCGTAHYDAGAEFTPGGAFTFGAGLSVADIDCSEATLVLPLPYVGIGWYFGRGRRVTGRGDS